MSSSVTDSATSIVKPGYPPYLRLALAGRGVQKARASKCPAPISLPFPRESSGLNQSRSGIYMDGGINTGLSGSEELLCPSLQDSPAPLLDLFPPRGQLGEEVTQFFLHRGSGAQAQVRGGLFPCPVPDRLGSIEIRTVSRQAH